MRAAAVCACVAVLAACSAATVFKSSAAAVSGPAEQWQVFVPYGDQVKSNFVFSPSGATGCTILQDQNDNAVVFCFKTSTGAKIFRASLGMFPVNTPQLTVTSDLVLVAAPTSVTALDATTGSQVWANQDVEASVAVVDTSVNGNGVAFVGYGPQALYGLAANGTQVWSFNGQFGECSFFPTPIYNQNGTFLACARTLVGGFPAIFGFDVPTGSMLWFDYNQGNDPNPRWADGQTLVYLKANESEWVTTYVVDVRTGFPKWSWPTNMQHATGTVLNGSIVVIGTWASTTALSLADGSVMWALPDPIDLTSELSVPIPAGPNGDQLALFHLQLSEHLEQSLRRVDPTTGTVLWNSTMNVNGAAPWHYAAASNRLATRTPNYVYGYDFQTGVQQWSQQVDENDFVAFTGNLAIETRDLQVVLAFAIGPNSADRA
uniref:Pyrrolo-quinoline quinone repeat domain-containing protein n=1 Tax=Neobodo designis TaxID=312471 RepID=A0A7S1LEL3_NEODS